MSDPGRRRSGPGGGGERRPGPGRRLLLAGVVGFLVVVNVAEHLGPENASLVLSAPIVAALLMAARVGGLSYADLGLSKRAWGPGLRWAAAAVLAVGGLYALVLVLPATRPWLLDSRDHLPLPAALLTGLVLIPARTVLPEEFAFRGVLYALLNREWGARVATGVSSALFGLWHLLPALHIGRPGSTMTLSEALSARWPAAVVTVSFTAAAGVVFSELRRRSGSLLAPIGLHWATNGLGALASALAWLGVAAHRE